MRHGGRSEGGFGDMRILTAGIVILLVLALAACAGRATKAFTVSVSPYSMEYTPSQITDYLRSHGYQRVKFEDFDSGIMVYDKRSAESDEQHFRLVSYPQIEVVIKLEKIRYTFGESGPRVIVWFKEHDSDTLSEFATEEYQRLRDNVVQLVGADRVEVWKY